MTDPIAPSAPLDIGARLRYLRESAGVSQRELAKRAGVTNSTISLIEQNRVSPSVASLKKVLDGLPMALSAFFAGDDPAPRRIFYTASDMTDVTFDHLRYRLVGGADPNHRRLTVMREVYDAGADTGATGLVYEGEEGGFIIAGQIELTVGAECRVLSAGDGYYFDTTQPHRFRNPFAVACELMSASTTAQSGKIRGESHGTAVV